MKVHERPITMKNLLLLCFLLTLAGVFGVEVKSVVEGESVTLNTDLTDIPDKYVIEWMFNGESKIIATIDRETSKMLIPGNKRFEGRLKLNNRTGDLTINNIKTNDSGEYKLEIKARVITKKTFSVSVRELKFVMEGDSVTLPTGVTRIQSNNVKWKFKGADLTDSRYTNSEVNPQTGDLNITNIKLDQSGEYKVEINNSGSITHKTFNINVRDRIMMSVSVMEGQPVTLNIHIQSNNVKWKFNGADLTDSTLTNSEVNPQTGDLNIKDIKHDQSGEYKVEINNSGSITYKTFNINVMEPSRGSHITGARILIGVVLGFIVLEV